MSHENDKGVAHGIAYKYLDDTDSGRRLQSDIESALATVRAEVFKEAAGIARAMASGETFETGRQKALNIAAALEAVAEKRKGRGMNGPIN